MSLSYLNRGNHTEDSIIILQREIALLESELCTAKDELQAFEMQIQMQLRSEILKVQELFAIYKQQKLEKKAKRLEQKKRGKNYKEPMQRVLFKRKEESSLDVSLEKQEMKRLYKEAVVYVHPDKFQYAGDEEEIKAATSITAQLNGVYERGDLEELLNLYHYIVSGYRGGEAVTVKKEIISPKTRIASLNRKKAALNANLENLKSCYTYTVLKTYENPLLFIDELREQFRNRISQLEKRTRTRGDK